MSTTKVRQLFAAWMIAALVLSSTAVLAGPAVFAAPVAQGVRTQQAAGTIPGGEFAKIWLGLVPETKGQNITVISEWDRVSPGANGVGFYILSEAGLNQVLNGSTTVQEANLSAGSRLAPESPDNQLGAVVQGTDDSYTIVVFNDSNADANFTLKVTNGFILDDSAQIRDMASAPQPAGEATEEAAEEEATAEETEEAAEAVETPAPVVETPEATATPAPGAAVTATVETPTEPVVAGTPGVARAQELRGELPEQNAQHYLELEPSERDGNVSLILSFEPQDSSELARRLNFWVLEEDDFIRYQDASTNVRLSDVSIAAGSSDPQLPSNQRRANFTASGFGPYTVIVYNNSRVPGSYTLRVEGGILIDDSGQTLTAQRGVTTTGTVTGTVTGTTTATDGETPAVATPAAGGREGEPGGTYTVQAGDSLSLIARDIYGELGLWDEICAFNNLSDCNAIEVGQELQLPTRNQIGAGITAAATPATPAATPAAAATPEPEEEAAPVTETGTLTSTTAVTGTGTTTDTEAPATEAEEEADTGSTATVDLVAALEGAGSFNTLVRLLDAAGLTAALEGNGPFTIFAPTDAAFDDLEAASEGALNSLLANPTSLLTQILLIHVLPGEITSDDITNGMQETTQQGSSVTFTVSGDSVKVNDSNVVVPDIEATNGVIHAIDKVIIPPQ